MLRVVNDILQATGLMIRTGISVAGMPITYKTFAGADHSTIMTQGSADMLAFLKTVLP